MPNCFTLTPKGAKEPAKLSSIDNRLYRELGFCEPDPEIWFYGWYNIIGLGLACGKSLDDMKQILKNQAEGCSETELVDYRMLIEVCNFLNQHYETNAWYEAKR